MRMMSMRKEKNITIMLKQDLKKTFKILSNFKAILRIFKGLLSTIVK